MFSKNSYKFLEVLKENNNREWFAENKQWYEQSKTDFESLVAQVIQALSSFKPKMKYLEPKKCIFRIYRDTRFSMDKTPYKTHFGAVFTPPGLGKSSGYYLHLDPAESFLTCGHYMLPPDQLKAVRKGIYDDYETLRSILDNKQFKETIGDFYRDDDMLQRVPNGFDKEHPAAEYIKLKHFYVQKNFTEKELFSEDFIEFAAGIYKMMKPLNDFLNELIS